MFDLQCLERLYSVEVAAAASGSDTYPTPCWNVSRVGPAKLTCMVALDWIKLAIYGRLRLDSIPVADHTRRSRDRHPPHHVGARVAA